MNDTMTKCDGKKGSVCARGKDLLQTCKNAQRMQEYLNYYFICQVKNSKKVKINP